MELALELTRTGNNEVAGVYPRYASRYHVGGGYSAWLVCLDVRTT
jgi:hypothetical protein